VGIEAPAGPGAAHGRWWLAFRVFDEPAAVFRQLASTPHARIPLLLFVLANLGVASLVPARVLQDAAGQQFRALEERRPGAIPPDLRERAISQAGSIRNRAGIFIAATVAGIVMVAIASGVLMLVFNAIGDSDMRFRDEWSIAWHAYMPQVLGIVVTWAGISLTNDMQFRPGLGFLVPPDTSAWGHSLAQQFTFFGGWNVFLLAVGNQVRTGAKGLGTPLAIVTALWVLANLVFAVVGRIGLG
jgi:hypothetical protein